MHKIPKRSLLAITYLVASAIWRFLPHWANVTPFTALALYTGSQHQSRWSLLTPIIPLALTDLFFGWHATIPFVYGSLLIIGLLGRLLRTQSPLNLMATSLVGSLFFFIITNFGVWLTSGLYPHTLGGLLTACTLGIPFYKNALLGDLLFSLAFFGFMRLMKIKDDEKVFNLTV
jgi:hypothetical protein